MHSDPHAEEETGNTRLHDQPFKRSPWWKIVLALLLIGAFLGMYFVGAIVALPLVAVGLPVWFIWRKARGEKAGRARR